MARICDPSRSHHWDSPDVLVWFGKDGTRRSHSYLYRQDLRAELRLVSRSYCWHRLGRGSLPTEDNIKLECSSQSPKDKSYCRTDNSKIQQQSPLLHIFELQPNL